jgi:hypothetical protein
MYDPLNLLKCLSFLGNNISELSFNSTGWMQASSGTGKFFIAPMRG